MNTSSSNQRGPGSSDKPPVVTGRNRRVMRAGQKVLISLIVLLAILGFQMTLTRHPHLFYASAALYIGVPLLLALAFTLTDKAQSAMGATMKGITITLLMSAPVLQEGFICILMAAPIFYLVGALAAWAVDHARRKQVSNKRVLAHPVIIGLALLSFEGTTESLSMNRQQLVSAERIVAATPAEVERQLARPMALDREIPFVSRIFPQPVSNQGQGLSVGDMRSSHLVYKKHIWFNAVTGDTVFRVSARSPQHAVFTLISDDSYISHYLRWQTSTVRWQAVDAGHTRVTWEIAYERKLDPAWYFGPLQRFYVGLAAGALIDNLATPPARTP